jgi:hypothetical protein
MFSGMDHSITIESGSATVMVPLGYGPRVMYLGIDRGDNVFFTDDGVVMPDAPNGYRFYGGHRLWIAPESPGRSMQPENSEVSHIVLDGAHQFVARADVHGIIKSLIVRPLGRERFIIEHRIRNLSSFDLDLAPWALSMLAPGSIVYFPQPPFESHSERLTPNRPVVTWGYTELADPRYEWGPSVASLRQDSGRGPTKVGTFLIQGYAAAQCGEHFLIKVFESDPTKTYADMGCNFETFTNESMIEIETLGPLTRLVPDSEVVHRETWWLKPHTMLSGSNVEQGEQLAVLARELLG